MQLEDLNRLTIFARVAETESFTRAALALGLPKSSVSRAIAALENELGVRLLQRTTRRLRLTEAGEVYLRGVQSALSSLEEATAAAMDSKTEPRGVVRLTAPVDMANMLLDGPLAAFVRQHPQIRVELSLTARRVDLVQEGFHLAIRAGPLQDSSLVARRVGLATMGLFASRAYTELHGVPRTVEDLAQHACVLFRGRQGRVTWEVDGPQGRTSVEVSGSLDVDDISFVQAAVLRGMGVGLLPLYVLAQPLELVHLMPEFTAASAPIHVVSPPLRYEPAAVKLLRSFLIEELTRVPWERRPPTA